MRPPATGNSENDMALLSPAIREQVLLAPMTTLGVGGRARYYLRATTAADVEAGVIWARERELPLLVFGGGSNLLIADEGFDGLALHNAVRGISLLRDGSIIDVTVGAGESWRAFVSMTVRERWAGLECLAGIPGSAGATPIQNVGAYGQEVSETLLAVDAIDLHSGSQVLLSAADCCFGYRDSRFKGDDRGRFLVLQVSFRLQVNGPPSVRYAEVERQLAQDGTLPHPSLMDVHAAVLAIRQRKSMLIDARDPNSRSAGSFFINPVLSPRQIADFERAATLHLRPNEHPVIFPTAGGGYKVPAAWLIEHAGFARGQSFGPVAISSNHALALVNRGNATAQQIVEVARAIRDRVLDRFGIALVPEPTFVGINW